MRGRILLGVAAWLAGASAATGGSLLAVSALGQGMDPPGGQVTVGSLNRALANEAGEPPAAQREAAGPLRSASLPHSSSSPQARHRASAPHPGTAGGTVLASQGGMLVASCAGARAYLVSWSPQQGFEATGVTRGPATSAEVTFTGWQLTVTTVVSCHAGTPVGISTSTPLTQAGGEELPAVTDVGAVSAPV